MRTDRQENVKEPLLRPDQALAWTGGRLWSIMTPAPHRRCTCTNQVCHQQEGFSSRLTPTPLHLASRSGSSETFTSWPSASTSHGKGEARHQGEKWIFNCSFFPTAARTESHAITGCMHQNKKREHCSRQVWQRRGQHLCLCSRDREREEVLI